MDLEASDFTAKIPNRHRYRLTVPQVPRRRETEVTIDLLVQMPKRNISGSVALTIEGVAPRYVRARCSASIAEDLT